MFNTVLVVVSLFLVLVAGASSAQTSFAVLPMEKRGEIKPEKIEEAQNSLHQVLNDSKKYRLIDRQRVNDILKEQAFQVSGATDPNDIIKLGKILNVEKFVYTVLFRKEADQFAVHCSVMDVSTGQTELVKEVTEKNYSAADMGRFCAAVIIETYPLLGKIEAKAGDFFIVNLGRKMGLKNGDRLFVARENAVGGDDGKIIFKELVRVGALEIVSSDEAWSKARTRRMESGVSSFMKDYIVSPDPVPKKEPLISSVPLLKNVKKGPLVLDDDMKKKQYLSVMGNSGDSYKDGKLQVNATLRKSGYAYCFYSAPFDGLDNSIVEGTIEFQKTTSKYNRIGILFRADGKYPGNRYALFLNNDGQYLIEISKNGKLFPLVPISTTPHLNRGAAANTFKIVAYDSKFDFYINEAFLIGLEEEQLERGAIGFMTNAGNYATINDIKIWKAEQE